MSDFSERSTSGLVSDLLTQVTDLFRKEIMLLRAEMGEKVTDAAVAVGMILAGAIVAITALNVLAAALVAAIANLGVPDPWSALIVGVGFAVFAAIMAKRGLDSLKLGSLAPQRTTRSVGRDAEMVKEKL